jgi:hypothetical protein
LAGNKENGKGGWYVMDQIKNLFSTPFGAVMVFLAFIGGGLYVIKKFG